MTLVLGRKKHLLTQMTPDDLLPFAKMLVSVRLLKGGNFDDRPDMIQEAQLAGWQACQRCNRDRCFGEQCSFVRMRMRGAIEDWLRKRYNVNRWTGITPEMLPVENVPEGLDGRLCEMNIAVDQCMKRLDKQQRGVLGMKYWDGVPQVEIAAKVHLTQSRVSQVHTEALGKIAECLGITT